MEKTNVEIIEGPVIVSGEVYTGRAFGINIGAVNAVVCANTDEELMWIWSKVFPDQKLDLNQVKSVVIGQRDKTSKRGSE